jgi:drug/metabolite transporter (DMT)-like permease
MGIFLHVNLGGWSERLKLTLHYTHDFALPAIFLFIANHCNGIALDKIGISLTYTSKCIIPLATVLITVLIEGLGALPSVYALLTLIPIATGVALASWKTPTFEKTGFTAAMLSSFSQAALNFTSKRALKKTGVSGLQAQGAMATVAFSLAIGMTAHTILRDRERKSSEKYVSEVSTCIIPPTWLTLLAISAYHLEYLLSFLFLKLVQPISFGTCDAIRRLGIIIAGRIMFGGEPFSKRNYLGMILAIFGAFSYSIASNLT